MYLYEKVLCPCSELYIKIISKSLMFKMKYVLSVLRKKNGCFQKQLKDNMLSEIICLYGNIKTNTTCSFLHLGNRTLNTKRTEKTKPKKTGIPVCISLWKTVGCQA